LVDYSSFAGYPPSWKRVTFFTDEEVEEALDLRFMDEGSGCREETEAAAAPEKSTKL